MKMNVFLVLSCLALAAMEHLPSFAHMVPEYSASTSQAQVLVPNALSQSLDGRAPPVVIVELPKLKKNKRAKKQKKNKIRKRPPPPANCVPSGSSCKSSNSVCCDFCAFCQCRLFRTVCFCRMGNPRC